MSEVCVEDELDLQSLLKQLLRSISDQISSAPSTEHAEDVLLHLEETDKNFHNYELVKYLRGYVERSLGSVVDEGMKTWTRGEGQHAVGSGHDALIQALTHRTRDSAEYHQMMQTLKSNTTAVVESLIGVSEEELSSQSNVQYVDECSDSDSSFNQVRAGRNADSSHISPHCTGLQTLSLCVCVCYRAMASSDRSSCRFWLNNWMSGSPKRLNVVHFDASASLSL
uniref:BROMI N-terminal domain-containing protein n=1 Tax=Gouania willdenowi TaxID=441366 RepID=A0A8C5DFZ6_GOUWI